MSEATVNLSSTVLNTSEHDLFSVYSTSTPSPLHDVTNFTTTSRMLSGSIAPITNSTNGSNIKLLSYLNTETPINNDENTSFNTSSSLEFLKGSQAENYSTTKEYDNDDSITQTPTVNEEAPTDILTTINETPLTYVDTDTAEIEHSSDKETSTPNDLLYVQPKPVLTTIAHTNSKEFIENLKEYEDGDLNIYDDSDENVDYEKTNGSSISLEMQHDSPIIYNKDDIDIIELQNEPLSTTLKSKTNYSSDINDASSNKVQYKSKDLKKQMFQ